MFLARMIDSGMKSGIEEAKHKNVATYYGNYENYLHTLGINDTTLGYVFLLDRKGTIRQHGQGSATQTDLREMIDQAKNL